MADAADDEPVLEVPLDRPSIREEPHVHHRLVLLDPFVTKAEPAVGALKRGERNVLVQTVPLLTSHTAQRHLEQRSNALLEREGLGQHPLLHRHVVFVTGSRRRHRGKSDLLYPGRPLYTGSNFSGYIKTSPPPSIYRIPSTESSPPRIQKIDELICNFLVVSPNSLLPTMSAEKTVSYVSAAASKLDVSKLIFSKQPLPNSNPSIPYNVTIHYADGANEAYVWYLTPDPAPTTQHPTTGAVGTVARSIQVTCPFGISTMFQGKDGKEPIPLDPKIDVVVRGSGMTLVNAIQAIEEAAKQHYIKNFPTLNKAEYEKMKKNNGGKDVPVEKYDLAVGNNFKSCIKDLKSKDENGNLVSDPNGKIISLKIRAPEELKKGGISTLSEKAKEAAKKKYTDFRMAKVDTHGFVMDQSHDTKVEIHDAVKHQNFKGHALSLVIQPSSYWFNATGFGVKFFLSRVRVIPRTGGSTESDQPDFSDVVVGQTAEAAEVSVDADGDSEAEKVVPPAASGSSDSDDSEETSESEDSEDDS